jgi:hypothetical protein
MDFIDRTLRTLRTLGILGIIYQHSILGHFVYQNLMVLVVLAKHQVWQQHSPKLLDVNSLEKLLDVKKKLII